jgi:hypothetical protein
MLRSRLLASSERAAFHRQRQRVARFVIAQTHSDFVDKCCLSIGRNLRQLFARYFRPLRRISTNARARYLGRSREARPLQIAPEFTQASVEVVGS